MPTSTRKASQVPAKSDDVRPVLAFVGELAEEAGALSDEAVKQEISATIIDRVLAARSAEEVFALGNQSLPSGQDFVNVPHKVLSIAVRPSGKKGGLGAYLVIDAVTRDGESITFGIGAATAVAQYKKLERIGYDGWVAIRSKSTSTDGNEVLYLEAA